MGPAMARPLVGMGTPGTAKNSCRVIQEFIYSGFKPKNWELVQPLMLRWSNWGPRWGHVVLRVSELLGVKIAAVSPWLWRFPPTSLCYYQNLCVLKSLKWELAPAGTGREIRVVWDTADVGYLVYLWTEIASMTDEGNQEYFLVIWRLEGLVSKERRKRLVYVTTFKTKLLISPCWSGPDSASAAGQPLTSVLVYRELFLHCHGPFPSPASFLCLLHFPFCELYLTLLATSPVSAACCVARPTWGFRGRGKEMVVSRNCAHFLKTFFPPRAKTGSFTLIALWSGLSAWASELQSPLLPEAALRKGDKPRPLQWVSVLAFVLFLNMKLWLDSEISL